MRGFRRSQRKLERFARAFPTHAYQSEDERQRLNRARANRCRLFLEDRRNPIPASKSSRTAIHEVFRFFQPHGDAYAYISSWLTKATTGSRYPPCRTSSIRRRRKRIARGVRRAQGCVRGRPTRRQRPVQRAFRRRGDRGGVAASQKNLWLMLLNTDRFRAMNASSICRAPAIGSASQISSELATPG